MSRVKLNGEMKSYRAHVIGNAKRHLYDVTFEKEEDREEFKSIWLGMFDEILTEETTHYGEYRLRWLSDNEKIRKLLPVELDQMW